MNAVHIDQDRSEKARSQLILTIEREEGVLREFVSLFSVRLSDRSVMNTTVSDRDDIDESQEASNSSMDSEDEVSNSDIGGHDNG